jgi:hypothetical protein
MMQFDPRSPAFRVDPYPTYDLLRSFAPRFFWEPWQLWFLTSYDDVNTLLRDDRFGHVSEGFIFPERQRALFEMQSRWILTLNPPDHTRLRGLVHKAFTPRTVAQLRGTVQAMADELIDRATRGGDLDLVRDFAYPLPVAVICTLLGVPAADHARFHIWSDAIAASLDLTEDEAVYNRASDATVDLLAYLDDLLRQRRADPQADLLSALAAAEEAGDRLTREELLATCALLLIAGHETTVNLIGNGMLALLRNPDQWQRLKDEPGLGATAVEELLRYDSPVQLTSRVAMTDVAYKDVVFRAGTAVSFLLGAANRDPAAYSEPDRLDIGRENNRHMAFGGGIHYCLGAPLARMEGEIAFTTLARRLPTLSLATDEVTYRDNYTLRGLTSLPVRA